MERIEFDKMEHSDFDKCAHVNPTILDAEPLFDEDGNVTFNILAWECSDCGYTYGNQHTDA